MAGVCLLDQAGWHLSNKLVVPPNITILPLPPKCPELSPVENIWQYMRDDWLSNRVFQSYDNILDQCCNSWNKPVAQPWTIMSIGFAAGHIGSDQREWVLVDYLGIRRSSPEALAAVAEPDLQFVRTLKSSYWQASKDLDVEDRSAFFALIALRFAGKPWPTHEQGKEYYTNIFLPSLHEGALAARWTVVEPGGKTGV